MTASELAVNFYGQFGIVPTEKQIAAFIPDFYEATTKVYASLEDLVCGYCDELGIEFGEADQILIRDLKAANEEAMATVGNIMGIELVYDLVYGG